MRSFENRDTKQKKQTRHFIFLTLRWSFGWISEPESRDCQHKLLCIGQYPDVSPQNSNSRTLDETALEASLRRSDPSLAAVSVPSRWLARFPARPPQATIPTHRFWASRAAAVSRLSTGIRLHVNERIDTQGDISWLVGGRTASRSSARLVSPSFCSSFSSSCSPRAAGNSACAFHVRSGSRES